MSIILRLIKTEVTIGSWQAEAFEFVLFGLHGAELHSMLKFRMDTNI